MARIELGAWTPGRNTAAEAQDGAEQTFREMATDWLEDRKRNPAIREGTISNNEWQLTSTEPASTNFAQRSGPCSA